jgi:exodeoxyribonuclease VII large subunit
VTKNQNQLKNIVVQISHNAKFDIKERFNIINQYQEKLKFRSSNLLNSTSRNIVELEKNLDLLDPIHVMKRGFSITRQNGKAITSSSEIENEVEIVTEVAEGQFRSIVKK